MNKHICVERTLSVNPTDKIYCNHLSVDEMKNLSRKTFTVIKMRTKLF